jgi:predicted transcriptional regulator
MARTPPSAAELILDFLVSKEATRREIEECTGLGRTQIGLAMIRLQKRNLIEFRGFKKRKPKTPGPTAEIFGLHKRLKEAA